MQRTDSGLQAHVAISVRADSSPHCLVSGIAAYRIRFSALKEIGTLNGTINIAKKGNRQ